MRIRMDNDYVITILVRQCNNEVKDDTIQQNVEYNDSYTNISVSFYIRCDFIAFKLWQSAYEVRYLLIFTPILSIFITIWYFLI